MPSIKDRIIHGWNAFVGNEKYVPNFNDIGYSLRPDRPIFTRGNERSIVTSIFNRIAIDVSSVRMNHVRVDDEERYLETIKDSINECLTLQANIDQTGRAMIIDLVESMFDEGCIAVVPVDTSINPKESGSYNIETLRVGRIIQWYPKDVKIKLYNEKTAKKEEIILPKKIVAIIENPLYSIINEPNSTYKRLVRKLNLLDSIDEQSGSGKLDLIIQLPYSLKSPTRKAEAENRRLEVEAQLKNSKYGIAYIDATEHVTQLNRAVDNNLMKQIEFLTSMLYSQLGITEEILNGTANEQTMLNYYHRTIEPILDAIADEFSRKFLTKTARTQGQAIRYFRDPFKLVPLEKLADIADKMTRNAILSSNEIRATMGYKPSSDPSAEQLYNPNMPMEDQPQGFEEESEEQYKNVGQTPISSLNGSSEEENY